MNNIMNNISHNYITYIQSPKKIISFILRFIYLFIFNKKQEMLQNDMIENIIQKKTSKLGKCTNIFLREGIKIIHIILY